MQNFLSLLTNSGRQVIAAVTLMLALGLASTAAADDGFGVRVDCHGNGGNPSWATTKSLIAVMVRINNDWFNVYTGKMTNCGSDNSRSFFIDAFHATDITDIAVVSLGKDAFWIDDLEIWYGNFRSRGWSWGKDNNVGVCMSTQKSDGNSSYCYKGKAYGIFQKSVKFPPTLIAPR